MFFALNHTGPGNEEEIARADADIVDLEGSRQLRSQVRFTAENAEAPWENINAFLTAQRPRRRIHLFPIFSGR